MNLGREAAAHFLTEPVVSIAGFVSTFAITGLLVADRLETYMVGTTPTVNEASLTITNRGRADVTPTPASADLERVVLSAPGEPTNETNASADEPPAEPETTEKGETPASPSLLGALATMAARATGVVTSRG
jgi:hypothetical protein